MKYTIEKISYHSAMAMVVKNHYLHRKAPCRYAFGLFDGYDLIGVIVYGTPANRKLQVGICGPEEAAQVIELTRLWVRDGTAKNSESFLIGNTLRRIPEDIVVSYAEGDRGHLGIVYQASNFLYTGQSDRHCSWVVRGETPKHSRHMFKEYGGIKRAKEILGDDMVRVERPRKHRYVYLKGNRARRRYLLKSLRYPVQPYPKQGE